MLLREHGAEPLIIPAMGSHGGPTASGQRAMLAVLGIAEESVGAPIRASMETVQIGTAGSMSRARRARGGRRPTTSWSSTGLKSHTSFAAAVESGLAKMTAIGLGKQHGAEELHRLGPRRWSAGSGLPSGTPARSGRCSVAWRWSRP